RVPHRRRARQRTPSVVRRRTGGGAEPAARGAHRRNAADRGPCSRAGAGGRVGAARAARRAPLVRRREVRAVHPLGRVQPARRGRTAWDNGRPDHGDWSRYLTFMNAQLAELLTRYGEVGGIWFDGMWDKPDAPWQLDSTYTLIHRLQPAALVIPNHHQPPRSGEDAQTFEQDLPGANTAGFNTNYVSADVPLETSLTMNDSWGFNITDKDFKSVR